MPACAKPEAARKEVSADPMSSTCSALLRLGLEVADKRRKRATMPALPSAIERYALLRPSKE